MFESLLPKRYLNKGEETVKGQVAKKLEKFKEEREREINEEKRARLLETLHNVKKRPVVPYFDNDDAPYTKRVRLLAPEPTYEVWVQEEQLNRNITRHLIHIDASKRTKAKKNEEEQELEIPKSEEEEADCNDAEKFQSEGRRCSKKANTAIRSTIHRSGLEIIPHTRQVNENKEAVLQVTRTHQERHYTVLTTLLHMNILKRKWGLAYRIFAIMIRCLYIDVRSIWPLGLEIITMRAQQEVKDRIPTEYDFLTFFQGVANSDIDSDATRYAQFTRDEHFLNWLATFFPSPPYDHGPASLVNPVVYRKGTGITPPMFVHCLIWTLLMKGKFSLANERLEQLMIKEPYSEDGMSHWLQGFAYLLEAITLAKNMPDMVRVERLIDKAESSFEEAKKRRVVYPEKFITKEISMIRTILKSRIDVESSDEERKQGRAETKDSYYDFDADFEKYKSPDDLDIRGERNPDSEQEEFGGIADFDDLEE